MHGYRAYILGLDRHITDRIDLYCDNDDEAKERARQLVDGQVVELWDLDRKIATFEPDSTLEARKVVQQHIDDLREIARKLGKPNRGRVS